MAVIINGKPVEVRSLSSVSWHDLPELRLRPGEDCTERRSAVQGIVLHTTKGIPGGSDQRKQVIRPGLGPRVEAGARCARYWSTGRDAAGDKVKAGAHLVVDFDGQIACCADLATEAAYHAGPVNQRTIGVEIYQGSDAELYELQLDAVVRLCDWLTRRFGIQRQLPGDRYRSRNGPIRRLSAGGGRDFFGVYGHRDVSADRGAGDPGDAIMQRLFEAGYEDFDLDELEDIETWRLRQRQLRVMPRDGIPGPRTVEAIRKTGRPHGLWVSRPGDDADLVS